MNSWPVERAHHEILLAALFQDVAQRGDLILLSIGDETGPESALPERTGTAEDPIDFLGDVSVHKMHEVRELLGVLYDREEVKVIAENNRGDDFDTTLSLRPTENAEDTGVELFGRAEEVAGFYAPICDVDERPGFRNKA